MITPVEAKALTSADMDVADAVEQQLNAAVRGLPRGRIATVEVTDLSPSPVALAEIARRAAAAGWTATPRSDGMRGEMYIDICETGSREGQ